MIPGIVKPFIRLIGLFALLLCAMNAQAQTLTPATGGGAISADNAGGAYTNLTGPIYAEAASGNVGTGTIVLNAPGGFEFDVGGTAPTVLMTRIGGSGNQNSNNINDLSNNTTIAVSRTTTTLTITITVSSKNGAFCRLTWQNVRVHPTAGTPLASDSITKSGTSTMAGVTDGVTNFGPLTEVPGAANKLTMQTQPASSATAGAVIGGPPTVRIEDQFGNLRSTDTLTVTASRSTGTGTLQGTVSKQAVGGVVTYTNLSYNVAETMTIQFSRLGLTSATSTNVVVSPAAANKLVFTTQPGSATAGAAFGTQPVVKTQDQFGNNSTAGLGTTLNVTVSLKAGSGPLQGTATLNIGTGGGGGTVSYTNLRIDSAGTNKQLRATASGLDSAFSNVFTVSPAAAAQLTIQTQPSASATAGVAFAQQPVVKIEDQFGNLRSTDTLTVTASRSAGTGTLQGTVSRQAVAGVVTYSGLSYNVAETMSIVFSRTGLTSATSNDVVVSPAAANRLTIQTQPSPTATAGVVFAQQPVIRIEDQFGNLRSSDTLTVTASRSTGTDTLRGPTARRAVGGIVSYDSLFYTKAETMTIAFARTGLASATSNDIVVSPATIKRLGFTRQPDSATVYRPFKIQPIVATQDSFGNNSTVGLPVNLDVNISLTAGTGPLMGTTVLDIGTAGENGTVTYVDFRLDTAGTDKRLKASASGLDSALSAVFTVNNPVPTTLSIVPTSKTVFDDAFTMTVNGTKFVVSSVVRFNGLARPTNFVDSTQLTAEIPATDVDTGGTFNITVFSPTPGGGTSGAQPFTVDKRTTTTAVVADTNPSIFSHTVTFTATVTPSLAPGIVPTGTVEFFDSTTSLGTSSLSGGLATKSTSSLTAGSRSITATYRGDTTSLGSTSPVLTQTVNKATTTTSVSSNNNPSTFGTSVTFTATVTPSTATDTVEFFDGVISLGKATLSGGQATKTTSALTGGTHSVTAVYLGNSSFLTSTSSVLTQTVNKANSSTTIASNKNPATRLDSVRFTATVTPSTATGNVEFRDSLTTIGTAALSGGTAIFTTNALAHGDHPMTAAYLGSNNYNASTSSTLIQSVKDSSTVIVVSNLNPSTYLDSVTFTATVSPADSVTGTVQFRDGAVTLATVSLTAGLASLKIGSLTVGSHTISAVYSGDTKYFGKTSPNITQTVNKRSTATGLVSNLNPSFYGDSVKFTATITPGIATGNVTFYDSLTSLATVSLSSGSASLTRANLTAKTHRIRALYNGDSNFLTSADSILQVINKATPVVLLTSSLNPSGFGEQVTFTATITPSLATGTVQFFDSTTSLGTSGISVGTASVSISSLTKGTHAITAQYSGDANVNAGPSTPLSQVVVILSNGDFEKGSTFAANGWTVVNGSETNKWFVGTAAKTGGSNGAYISDDGGVTNQYTVVELIGSVVHIYKDVTFPPGESSIKLTFDWRGVGQSATTDFMNVFLAPGSVTPVAGTEVPSIYRLNSFFFNQPTFVGDTIILDGSNAGTTKRLIFSWENNATLGNQPPAAVDNIFITSQVPIPLTGTKTIGPGGNYISFSAAINDLNTNGVGSGGVTFNVTAGGTFIEDPPAVSASGALGNPIVFQRSGGGANPVLKPTGTAGSADFGFCISGGDYVTVDGIDIMINTGSAVEYGYLVRNVSTSNGANNNLIKNCKIRLNRSNTSSLGIFQVVGTGGGAGGVPTSSDGANSFNRYYNITMENSYGGFFLQGSSAFPDQSCEIGATGGDSTTVGALTANDIGTGSSSVFGIRAQNQSSVKIFNTTVRNLMTIGSGIPLITCNGIFVDNGASGTFGTCEVYNNTVFNLARNNPLTNGVVYGIRADISSGNLANVYNNVVHSLSTFDPSATSSVLIRAVALNTGGQSGTGSLYFNSVRIAGPLNATSAAFWFGNGTVNCQNNIFSNFTATQTGTPKHYAIYRTGGTIGTASNNILYAPNGNGFVGFHTADRTSLQLWAAAISSPAPSDGQEQGSTSANPNFTSATDLTFAGATPAANSGIPITVPSITTDILGLAGNRSTTPDIGAYETSATLNDQTAPVVTNVVIVSGLSPSVSATITDNSAAPSNSIIRLWHRPQGSVSSFTELDATVKPSGALNGTYSWSTSLSALAPGTYQFYLAARDTGVAGARISINPIWTTGFAGFSASDPPNFLNNPASYANVRTFTVDLTIVRVKVFLEGAYVGADSMRNTLKTGGHLASRFGAIPIPFRAVDSINIEIRDSAVASSATMRLFAPAWLLRDGTIRSFSDTSKASVNFNIIAGSYYIVVRHRNHLAIMSASRVSLSSASALYSFTTSQGQAYGANPMTDLGTGSGPFGMIAGDANGDGQVTGTDFNLFDTDFRGALTGYRLTDWNLDGQVTGSDFNIFDQNFRKAASSKVP